MKKYLAVSSLLTVLSCNSPLEYQSGFDGELSLLYEKDTTLPHLRLEKLTPEEAHKLALPGTHLREATIILEEELFSYQYTFPQDTNIFYQKPLDLIPERHHATLITYQNELVKSLAHVEKVHFISEFAMGLADKGYHPHVNLVYDSIPSSSLTSRHIPLDKIVQ